MEILTAIAVGVLFGAGFYMILRRNALMMFVGIVIITHGVNLLLFASGGLVRANPPLLPETGEIPADLADPVPQALILTSIVIGLGVQTFLLVLLYRLVLAMGSSDLQSARESEREEREEEETEERP